MNVSLFSMFVFIVFSSIVAALPYDDAVSYWGFEEISGNIAFDSKGNNDGILNGTIRTSGKIGNALSFDGINDFVEVADDASLDLVGSFSISVWIKHDDNDDNNDDIIISKYSSESSANYEIALIDNPVHGSAAQDHVWFQTSNSGWSQSKSSVTINDNSWTHLIGVHDDDANEFILYINGVESSRVTVPTLLLSNNSPLKIGNRSQLYNIPFVGLIDELAIWNRTLTYDEIGSLYNNGQGLNPIIPEVHSISLLSLGMLCLFFKRCLV